MEQATDILLINTALKEAVVGISRNGQLTHAVHNPNQQEHASFVQPAIKNMMAEKGMALGSIAAVAVVNGPGSYTGLRVGLSSAKGICFALNKPLILINTLEWMAFGNRDHGKDLVCPMIDARRMEVFTAVYDVAMHQVLEPAARILDENSLGMLLEKNTITFLGDGAEKWQKICHHPNAFFSPQQADAKDFAALAQSRFNEKRFDDLAYSEPFYTKAFYSTSNYKKQ